MNKQKGFTKNSILWIFIALGATIGIATIVAYSVYHTLFG